MTGPIYARDYAINSRMTQLAYNANFLQSVRSGATGTELAFELRKIKEIGEIFTSDAEIDAFASRHSFIRAQGVDGTVVGADVVAFRDLNDNSIKLGVAGVGNDTEFAQTVLYTNGVGFNDHNYAQVRDFYFKLR